MAPYANGVPSITQASFTRYRVGKLSLPSMTKSHPSRISSALLESMRVSNVSTATSGFRPASRARAEASFGVPTASVS